MVKQNAEVASRFKQIASESLSHVTVVQAFGAAPRLEAKFFEVYAAAAKSWGKEEASCRGRADRNAVFHCIRRDMPHLAFWQARASSYCEVRGAQGDSGSTVGEIDAVVYLIVDGCVAEAWWQVALSTVPWRCRCSVLAIKRRHKQFRVPYRRYI